MQRCNYNDQKKQDLLVFPSPVLKCTWIKKCKCLLSKMMTFAKFWKYMSFFYHKNLNVSDKSGKTTFGLALKSICTDNFFRGRNCYVLFFSGRKNISVHIFAVIIFNFNIKRTNFIHNRSKILNNPFSTVLFPPWGASSTHFGTGLVWRSSTWESTMPTKRRSA